MTDAKLIKFVSSFRRGIVGLGKSHFMCFAVCAPLSTLLEMNGVRNNMRDGLIKFEMGYCNHYWLELSDGRVVDPTADQFNHVFGQQMPKVYLGPPVEHLHKPSFVGSQDLTHGKGQR
jgi:hypothetical protein